jgi:hypothetical protein
LKQRQAAGELQILKLQDHIKLTKASIGYIPDFKCLDLKTGETFHVEAKGFETERWLMIYKLLHFYGPGKLEIWKGDWKRPFLKETIIPPLPEPICPRCLQQVHGK